MFERNLSGVGLGYQAILHQDALAHADDVDFFEIAPEIFIDSQNSRLTEYITSLKDVIPIVFHGLNLSLLSEGEINKDFLTSMANLASQLNCSCYTEHLSYHYFQDMDTELYLPPVYSEASLASAVEKIREVKHVTRMPFHFENVATLFRSPFDEMPEWEFIGNLCRRTDCGIILNLNSIVITAKTLGIDPQYLITRYPLEHVVSLTIVPEKSMNIMLRRFYGQSIDSVMWRLLDTAVVHSSIDTILIQRRHQENTYENMSGDLEIARRVLKAHGRN